VSIQQVAVVLQHVPLALTIQVSTQTASYCNKNKNTEQHLIEQAALGHWVVHHVLQMQRRPGYRGISRHDTLQAAHTLVNGVLQDLGKPSHTSHVTRHTSHVTRHTPHVTRHTPHVTRHTPHVACLSLRRFINRWFSMRRRALAARV
jgi:hypothetical protein